MKISRIAFLVSAPMALTLAAPAAAQDSAEDAQMAEVMEKMQAAFAAEPLTEAQEARLPAAQQAVASVMPAGIYSDIMRDTMTSVLDPIFSEMGGTMGRGDMAPILGLASSELNELEDEQMAELSAILDPVFADRTRLGIAAMSDAMGELVGEMEPTIREGLARAYAVRFDAQQLDDINAFFATESGAAYASESMRIFTDPQAMSGMMQGMPMMMERMPDMIGEMEKATAELPAPASWDTLSPAQRSRVAEILGISVSELQESMEYAAPE